MSPMLPGQPLPEDEMGASGPPAIPGEAPPPQDAMLDDPEPAELAAMLGQDIAKRRTMGHAMVDQAADAELQQVIGMVMASAQGTQTLDGPGLPG